MNNYIPKIMKNEEQVLTAIIANFVDGLLFFNRENKLSLINPRAEKIFGVRKQDLVGVSISELVGTPAFEFLEYLLGEGAGILFKKEVFLKKNLILEVSIIPIAGKHQRLGSLIILHDITREKRIERMKTEFVSLAAHQLRTPLSAIKWSLRMILDEQSGRLSPDQVGFLEKAYQSNERMIGLIDDLLNVAKIEEGKHIYNPVFADFEPIIQFVISSRREEIKDKELKVEFKRPQKLLPRIKIDVSKIRLVIQNLLDNAIKYTPHGGSVIISLKQINRKIECSIKDTGVGIFKEEHERVFGKFFRGTNVIKMETEGSGLGLFIAKNIVEAHKGKLWFESEPGKGSVFYFRLPIK